MKENIIMERFLCVRLTVYALQNFRVTQYLGHFKSEFDAVKSKVGLLIEKIKTRTLQPVNVPPDFN